LCFFFVFLFLRLVCPMLPVSLDWSFLIAPSLFCSVYLDESENYILTITLSNSVEQIVIFKNGKSFSMESYTYSACPNVN
jgi:hypothetical protein